MYVPQKPSDLQFIINYQLTGCDTVEITIDHVNISEESVVNDVSSAQPMPSLHLQDLLQNMVKAIASVYPDWAHTDFKSGTGFILGIYGRGKLVYIDCNDAGLFGVHNHISPTKKWYLMRNTNPFFIVKFFICLRRLICDNPVFFQEFIDSHT